MDLEKTKTTNNDKNTSSFLLEKLATSTPPDAIAMVNLGVRYMDGEGVTRDFKKAIALFQQAADLKNDIAMCNLGIAYEQGEGVEKNLDLAIEWYLKAVAVNSRNAVGSLRAYEKLLLLAQTKQLKPELLKKANHISVSALKKLSVCYENGYDRDKNPQKALFFKEMAKDKTLKKIRLTRSIVTDASYWHARGKPTGVNIINYLLITTSNPFKKWRQIRETAIDKLDEFMGCFNFYRHQDTKRFYAALKNDDIEELKKINREIALTHTFDLVEGKENATYLENTMFEL